MIRGTSKFFELVWQTKSISYRIPSLPSINRLLFSRYQQFSTNQNNSQNDQTQALEKQSKITSNSQKKKERVKIIINESDLEWKFVKGSGPGGQTVNKTSNCAVLVHKPSGIQVRSHASRELDKNKQYCLKSLSQKLDVIVNGENSKKVQKEQKKQKQDAKRQKRSAEKYGNSKKDEQIQPQDLQN